MGRLILIFLFTRTSITLFRIFQVCPESSLGKRIDAAEYSVQHGGILAALALAFEPACRLRADFSQLFGMG